MINLTAEIGLELCSIFLSKFHSLVQDAQYIERPHMRSCVHACAWVVGAAQTGLEHVVQRFPM